MSLSEELQRLHRLHESGVITAEEYAAAKAAVLNTVPAGRPTLSDPRQVRRRSRRFGKYSLLVLAVGVFLLVAGSVHLLGPRSVSIGDEQVAVEVECGSAWSPRHYIEADLDAARRGKADYPVPYDSDRRTFCSDVTRSARTNAIAILLIGAALTAVAAVERRRLREDGALPPTAMSERESTVVRLLLTVVVVVFGSVVVVSIGSLVVDVSATTTSILGGPVLAALVVWWYWRHATKVTIGSSLGVGLLAATGGCLIAMFASVALSALLDNSTDDSESSARSRRITTTTSADEATPTTEDTQPTSDTALVEDEPVTSNEPACVGVSGCLPENYIDFSDLRAELADALVAEGIAAHPNEIDCDGGPVGPNHIAVGDTFFCARPPGPEGAAIIMFEVTVTGEGTYRWDWGPDV